MKPSNLSNRDSSNSYKTDKTDKTDKSFESYKSFNRFNKNSSLNMKKLTSFNNTTNSTRSNKPDLVNPKIIESIFQVVKMRLALENITNVTYTICKNLIEENINLIDLKHMEVNSINKFVDDLIEIIKSKNNKVDLNSDLSAYSNSKIARENEKYNPRALSEEKFYRRRTIELGKPIMNFNN
jgi:hypothetical protein